MRRGRLFDRQAPQEHGLLRQRPPGHDGRDREARGEAGWLVTRSPHERQCDGAGEDRDGQGWKPVALQQAVVQGVRIGVQDRESAQGDGAGNGPCAQGPGPKRSLEIRTSEPGRVRSQVHSRQVRRDGDGQCADEDRRRVQPTREEMPGGVSDGDTQRGDPAHRSSQGKGCEH